MRWLCLLIVWLGVSGCVGFKASVPVDSGQWQAKGRVAVRHGAESRTGQFIWQHRGYNDFTVRVFGPWGVYPSELTQQPSGARLQVAGQGPVEAFSADDLSAQLLGVRLPVHSMTWWARGLSDPAHSMVACDEHENGEIPSCFDQLGWRVNVQYDAESASPWPRKVRMTSSNTRAILVFHEWSQ